MMRQPHPLFDSIHQVIARAPEWLRHDLAGKDLAARERAEESLATMVAAALADREQPPVPATVQPSLPLATGPN